MQSAQVPLTLLRRLTTCAILAEGRKVSGMESGMSTALVLSGFSTRETLKTCAYRPSIVLRWAKSALPVFLSDWPHITKMRVTIAESLCKTGIYFCH